MGSNGPGGNGGVPPNMAGRGGLPANAMQGLQPLLANNPEGLTAIVNAAREGKVSPEQLQQIRAILGSQQRAAAQQPNVQQRPMQQTFPDAAGSVQQGSFAAQPKPMQNAVPPAQMPQHEAMLMEQFNKVMSPLMLNISHLEASLRNPNLSAQEKQQQQNLYNELKTKQMSLARQVALAREQARAKDQQQYQMLLQQHKQQQHSDDTVNLGIFRTQAIRPGNVLPLRMIPIGTTIHAISLLPLGPAKLVRSAGTFGQLVTFSSLRKNVETDENADLAQQHTHAQVRLSSGEVRMVPIDCCAAIGTVSNKDHQHARLGKAGRSRWLGRRPKVRGVAMNPVDHPHGGGRGKSKSNKHPRSIYGFPLKFQRTRSPNSRNGNRMVVRPRPRRNGKRTG